MSQHLNRAQLLINQNRLQDALTEIQRYLANDPEDSYALALRATTLSRLKKHDEATRSAEQAIVYDPDLSFAHAIYAEVLIAQGKLKPAYQAINEAIRLDPDVADYYCQLAVIHQNRSAWKPMLEAAEQALALDPEDDQATNLRAMAQKRLRKTGAASTTLAAAMARNPEDPLTHANQGWLLLEQNKIEPALMHFREALRLDPKLDWARMGIIEALKARNFVYRWMLNFFFWMANFSPRTRWMIILGAWLGINILSSAEESLGAFGVLVTPLTMLYLAFVMMTWIADPLFNFLLRFDSYGKLALDRRQIRQSNWLAVCLATSVAFLLAATQFPFGPMLNGFFFALVMAIPVTTVFNTRRGKYRNGVAIYAFCLAGLMAWHVGHSLVTIEPLKAEIRDFIDRAAPAETNATMIAVGRLAKEKLEKDGLLDRDQQVAEKVREMAQRPGGLMEARQYQQGLFRLIQLGILASCFLPGFLPPANDHNEVELKLS